MSKIEQSPMPGGTGWLLPHRQAYLGELGKLGYAAHTVDLILHCKEQYRPASSVSWSNRLSSARGFTAWLKARDPRTEVPPKGLVPRRYQRPAPYIYSDDEIIRIVTEAAKLPSPRGLLGKTLATLFGLLAASGLRIGEALGLDDRDVDLDAAVLHVSNAKNGDSRFIPIPRAPLRRPARSSPRSPRRGLAPVPVPTNAPRWLSAFAPTPIALRVRQSD